MLKVGLKGITFFFLVVRPLRKMGRSRREQPAHRRSIHYRRGFGTFCPQGSFPCSRGSVPEVPYSDVPPCALSRTPHLSRPPCAFLFVSVPGRTASAARAGTVTALEKAPRSWLSPFAACLRCKGAGHEVFFFVMPPACSLFLVFNEKNAWCSDSSWPALDPATFANGTGLMRRTLRKGDEPPLCFF